MPGSVIRTLEVSERCLLQVAPTGQKTAPALKQLSHVCPSSRAFGQNPEVCTPTRLGPPSPAADFHTQIERGYRIHPCRRTSFFCLDFLVSGPIEMHLVPKQKRNRCVLHTGGYGIQGSAGTLVPQVVAAQSLSYTRKISEARNTCSILPINFARLRLKICLVFVHTRSTEDHVLTARVDARMFFEHFLPGCYSQHPYRYEEGFSNTRTFSYQLGWNFPVHCRLVVW